MCMTKKKKKTWKDLVTKRKRRHYRLKVCVPLKFICWSSNHQSDGIWRWGSLEVNWVRREMALVVKNLPGNAGDRRDVGLIPGSGGSSGEGNGNPLQYSCLGKSHGRADYRSWGCKELDMTEVT